MKKINKLILCLLLLVGILFSFGSIKAKAYYFGDLDQILQYDVRVTPKKDDGTLDINIHIVWKVLDSSSDGPLEWVKIGIPNYHATNITALSNNIKKIKYYMEDGSYIRIDFNKSYYADEVVDFSFSFNQSYMYHLYDDIVVYDYNPGWFNDIKVDVCNLYWKIDGVKQIANQDLVVYEEDGYYKLSSPLNYGESIKINLSYERSYFGELSEKMQYTSKYVKPTTILIRIGIIAGIVAAIILLYVYAKSKQDPYMNERGFVTGYYHHYWFYGGNRHYYGKTVNAKGARIVNPSSSSGSSGGYHGGGGGGCACACACACAGGGRAGCSKKDFYHTNLSSTKVLEAIEEVQKDI